MTETHMVGHVRGHIAHLLKMLFKRTRRVSD
jgi:hypothetical protein